MVGLLVRALDRFLLADADALADSPSFTRWPR